MPITAVNRWLLGLVLSGLWLTAQAADIVSVCYHYGCKRHAAIQIDASERADLARLFADVGDAARERRQIAFAVQYLYVVAGMQSPIYQDKGGNFSDGTAPGRMDCVDHSQNTSGFLHYLAAQGWLKYHRVATPVYRNPHFLDLHYAALIQDGQSRQWVVDSWFHDFGALPEVVDYASWHRGWTPEQEVSP